MPQKISRPFDPMAIDSVLNEDDVSTSYAESSYEQLNRWESTTRLRAQTTQLPAVTRPTIARRETANCLTTSTRLARSPIQLSASHPTQWQPLEQPKSQSTSRRPSAGHGPRPKYTIEQVYFIWYHRTDLVEPWDQVLAEYELQFEQHRNKGGLQCKFYRLLDDHKVEKVRAQTRSASDSPSDRVGKYGVIQRTNKRFKWMRYEHIRARPLPQFSGENLSSNVEQSCSGCSECGGP